MSIRDDIDGASRASRPPRRRVLRALALVPALLAAGCAMPFLRGGLPRELRVGFAVDQEPFAFWRLGVPAGIEADLAREVERRAGSRFTYVPLPADALLDALRERRIDIAMGGFGITRDRAAVAGFTEPYLRSGLMALAREADLPRLAEPNRRIYQLDVRIGVVRGTQGEAFTARRMAAKAFRFDRLDDAVRALAANEVDYVVHDPAAIWRVALSETALERGLVGIFDPLTEEPLAWAVRVRDAGLRERLSAHVERLRSDGTVSRVVSTWLRARIDARRL